MFVRVVAVVLDDADGVVWSYEHAEKVINDAEDAEDTLLRTASEVQRRIQEARDSIGVQVALEAPGVSAEMRRRARG